jgi:hypothetical protein
MKKRLVFLMLFATVMLFGGANIPESQKAKQSGEVRPSTMRVIEQGVVEPIKNDKGIFTSSYVYYSLVEIQGIKFLFLTTGSSDGGVSAIQVAEVKK